VSKSLNCACAIWLPKSIAKETTSQSAAARVPTTRRIRTPLLPSAGSPQETTLIRTRKNAAHWNIRTEKEISINPWRFIITQQASNTAAIPSCCVRSRRTSSHAAPSISARNAARPSRPVS
ncbi:50S ribosomal protein L18, partial [Dysosmobacter welbionis]